MICFGIRFREMVLSKMSAVSFGALNMTARQWKYVPVIQVLMNITSISGLFYRVIPTINFQSQNHIVDFIGN